MAPEILPYEPAEHLESRDMRREYLRLARQSGDAAQIHRALRNLARARAMRIFDPSGPIAGGDSNE